jgi:hypothetical protein
MDSVLHKKALGLAESILANEAQLLEVLVEMHRKKEILALGYAGLFEYVHVGLKLSRARAYYFWKVAEKACEVPLLRKAVAEGRLSISQARRIAPVVTTQNAAHWIAQAEELKQVDLEIAVAKENPRAAIRETVRPLAENLFEFRCMVSSEFTKALAELQDLASRSKGASATLGETLEFMKEATLEKHSARRRALRSAKRAAERAAAVNGREAGSHDVRAPVSSGNGTPAKPAMRDGHRTAIPLPVRHLVVLRDENRCSYTSSDGVRCGQTRWTQLHHPHEVSRGGAHSQANLTILCWAHHKLVHETAARRGLA